MLEGTEEAARKNGWEQDARNEELMLTGRPVKKLSLGKHVLLNSLHSASAERRRRGRATASFRSEGDELQGSNQV